MKEFAAASVCPHCGYGMSTEPENKQYLFPGSMLGANYMVGAVIGAGGFGVTYVGWDRSLNRKVAIKEYFPSSLSTRIPGQTNISAFSGEKQQIFNHGKKRFWEEAQLLMQFTGEEGIVSVYDVLESNGTVYMVMEFVEGITLKQSIERFGPLSEKQLLDLIVPMLLSLKFVHNAGFAHRDISPDNILCQPDGHCKLIDFGAARYAVMEESQSLSVIVKQGFTPIEQYQSHGKQGPWTDLYAVGATMYKALTGITPEESLERMAKDNLKKPSQCGVAVSENTENAILAALNIRAAHRPQDVDAFLAILTGQEKGGLLASKRSKKKIIVALVAAFAVALGSGALVWGFLRSQAEEVQPDTQQIEVPDAISKTDSDAEVLFTKHQLHMLVTGGLLYDAEMIEQGYIAENLVVKQKPIGGTAVDLESTVGVVLSKGKKKEYIPSVTDELVENALHDFEKYGFGDHFQIQLDEAYSDTNMVGTVLSQSLSEDTAVDFDGQITLTVSLGRKDPLASTTTVTVEDYLAKNFDDLKEELLKDNVYLVKSASIYSSSAPYGAILFQSPEAGSELQSGGAVYVITSLGQEMARVPDVRYLSLEEAKTALMEKGLGWTIRYAIEPEVSVGLVAEQGTAPGFKTAFGSKIELVVSAETESTDAGTTLSFTVTPDTATLPVGETIALQCSYAGEADVLWATSNPYIAEVDQNGIVTAKNFGSTTVIAAVDGNIVTATITVTDEEIFTKLDDHVLVTGDTVSLTSAIPETIRKDVVWRSSYPTVASVSADGMVTALDAGYTSITATYQDRTTTCSILVNPKVEYIQIRKDALLGKLDKAKQVLTANGISYDVEDTYHDTVAAENVTKVHYVGYSDDDSFYIAVNSKVTLHRSLGKNTVQSIQIKTYPTKTKYLLGEAPDYTGLVLTAQYKDGMTKDITKGYSAASTALTTLGTHKLTISYEGQSTTLSVTVEPIPVTALTVTPTTLSCIVGETKTLTVTVAPQNATDRSVTVTSSDSSVVKADGTKLTAQKAGNATITVTTSNGKTATCTVTVSLPAVSSISLSDTKLTLNAGETKKLTATISPKNAGDPQVSWSSSNEKIATVDASGKVTAKGAGTATINAKTGNGKTATCSVQVSIPVTGIELPTAVELKPGETQTIQATVMPSNATDKTITWTSSEPQVATVDAGGKVTAIRAGTTVVTATTANGKSASCTVTVLGEATLTLQSAPTQTEYYIGDMFQKAGLVLRYTDAYGVTSSVTNGYMLSTCDMYKEGSQTVTVTYQNLQTTFAITVKTPSITLTKLTLQDRLFLTVSTDPAEQDFTWSSSDPKVFDFVNGQIVPVSTGTAYACVTMVYNGIEYTDFCPITVEMPEEDYVFSIWCKDNSNIFGWVCGIETDIPDFDLRKVKWSVSDGEYWVDDDGYLQISWDSTVTVQATYGSYSDSCTIGGKG